MKKDINGVDIKEGDIVAEGIKGKEIWDGKAILVERPLGVVVVYNESRLTSKIDPEDGDFFNVIEIRHGSVRITDKAEGYLGNHSGSYTKIYLSRYDGVFYGWDNVEVIGNVSSLDID